MVEVTGANRPSFNGCYTEDENIAAYNGPAGWWIYFNHQDGHWYIAHKMDDIFEGRIFYGSTSSFDEPQGEYESFYDDSIATVTCKSVCTDDKQLSNAKSMKKKGKLHIKIPLN